MNFNQASLLNTQRFLPLFITQFLGAFNDNIFKNALVILITYHIAIKASNAQILVTMAAGLFILPFFLFSALAGQLADKYEKSKLIRIIKLAEVLIMIIAMFGFYLNSIVLLMTVLFALGMQATFFGPLKYAILPDQLNENELIAGNGLIEAGTFIAILLGTILGGILILHRYGEWSISLLILIVSLGGLLSSFYIPNTNKDNPELKIRFNIFKETYSLLTYTRKQWDLYLCVLAISWFWLVGAVFLAEFPVFAKDFLHANQSVVTYFLTLFSVGLAVGSLLCNKLLKGKVEATYVPLGALAMTLFIVDLYLISNHVHSIHQAELLTLGQFLKHLSGWRISMDLFLLALSGGIYTVPLYAILQARSAKPHRARVIASNNVMNALFMTIAAVGTVIMLSWGWTVNHVFLLIAILNGLVAIYICKLLPDILIRGFFHWLLTLLYRVKVNGIENYEKAGERVIIIANHTSFLDALLLATFLPDKLTFAVNTYQARKWWIRLFLHMVDSFPMNPTNPMAIKSLIHFMQENHRCVIFPEGRLTTTGALMKIYEGPGLVADKSGAKLLPIRIEGAQYTPFSRLRGKVRIRWMPSITITILPPEDLNVPSDVKGRKRRRVISNKLYDAMTEMMFEGSNYHKTLFSSLIEAISIHGRRHLIIEDIEREPTSYQTFITRCFILANLISRNTRPGEIVGILLPNMVSSALTFFAMQASSRVPAMLNFSTGVRNVSAACELAQIKTVYTSRRFVQLAKLDPMINGMKDLGINIIYLEDVRSKVNLFDKLRGLIQAQFPTLTYKIKNKKFINSDSAAVILFTSGSEGTPKGVVLSHANLQSNRLQLAACVDFTPSDKIFNALPIFHSFGLTNGLLLPLLSGVKLFLYPSPLHYRIVPELSYDTNSTIFFGTDTFLTGYAKYAHPYDFYSLRYVFTGAEKLREETRAIWAQKFGVRIFEGYGTTETSPVIAGNTAMQNKVGTVGRIFPGIQYKLIPVPGLDEGSILSVKGPNIMKGYLIANQPGKLNSPKDGWYETGDVVTIDEAGFVTIKGRVKRFAKIAGEMVSLTMVEQYSSQLWPDYRHAVINIPDTKKGEQIVLVTTNPNATREAIVSYAKSHGFSELSLPKKIIIIEEIPLLGTGKIDYTSVKNIVLGRSD